MAEQVILPTTVQTRDTGALGIGRALWLGPEFTPVRRGARVMSGVDPLDPDVRISAVAGQLPDHGVVGGWAAARLHEKRRARDDVEAFDGSARWDDGRQARGAFAGGLARVVVCTPRDSRLALRPDVRVFRSAVVAAERDVVGGVRISNPVRTAFDLARLLPVVEAVVGLDRLVHIGAVTPGDISELVAERRGARGCAAVRRALALVDGGAESPQESVLRLAWIRAALPRPQTNGVVTDRGGGFVARVDLIDPAVGVVGEYDGAVHSGARSRSRDAERQERLEALGLVVVRATAVDVRGPASLARWQQRLRSAYGRASRRPASARRWLVR